MSHQSGSQDSQVSIPIEVFNQLLAELKAANEKVEKIVSLAESVRSLESALNNLADKVDGIAKSLYHGDDDGGMLTKVRLLEQRMEQQERGWQKWMQIFGSICGALALVLAALLKAGV